MSEYKSLINRLIHRSKLDRKEIEKIVEQKKEAIGAGYLTNQGALFLIASDLGISLTDDSEDKRPMEDIYIEPVAFNDLQTKAKTLRSDRIKQKVVSNLLSPSMILGLLGFAGVIGYFQNTGNMPLEIAVGSLIAAVVSGIIWAKYPIRYLVKNEKTFLEFFTAYEKIREFTHRDSNINTGKYQQAVKDLAYYVNSWTRNYTPNDISELPESISSSLKNKIVPIYQENDSIQIEYFTKILEKIVTICHGTELSASILRSFGNDLLLFKVKETKKIEKERQTNLVYKLLWIPPLTGIILFYIFNEVDSTQVHASLGYSITIAVAVLIVIVTIVKRK